MKNYFIISKLTIDVIVKIKRLQKGYNRMFYFVAFSISLSEFYDND